MIDPQIYRFNFGFITVIRSHSSPEAEYWDPLIIPNNTSGGCRVVLERSVGVKFQSVSIRLLPANPVTGSLVHLFDCIHRYSFLNQPPDKSSLIMREIGVPYEITPKQGVFHEGSLSDSDHGGVTRFKDFTTPILSPKIDVTPSNQPFGARSESIHMGIQAFPECRRGGVYKELSLSAVIKIASSSSAFKDRGSQISER
ncbi:hypothetical protein CASFOL_009818 [Castilleja foliolosa]|uniref:Uncharacterized protein n=1 Tax=Castilleja foliolosa TaxID=1961234 RepID=A0ABD3DQR3_9LAMI